ncbi:hypothetical protein ACFWPJ_32940, partial [Nocardia sp. NPDC058497]
MTLHLHDIEHRELPPDAATAVRALATDIRHRLGDAPHTETLHDPVLLAQVRERATELPDAVRHAVRPPPTPAGPTHQPRPFLDHPPKRPPTPPPGAKKK